MEAVLTVREAIFALAPTLERMCRRGFELAKLTEKLHDSRKHFFQLLFWVMTSREDSL